MNTIRNKVQYIFYFSIFSFNILNLLTIMVIYLKKWWPVWTLQDLTKAVENSLWLNGWIFLVCPSKALCQIWCFCPAGKYIFTKEPDY